MTEVYRGITIKAEQDSLKDANGRSFCTIEAIDFDLIDHGFYYNIQDGINEIKKVIDENLNF